MTAYDPPSKLRIPFAVILGVMIPPLGLMTWIALSGSERHHYLRSGWVRGGFGVAAASALPLLALLVATELGLGSDPNPNPIGLGLLMLVGAGLGTMIAAAGVVLAGRTEG
jgi:hypothetical protein